MGNKSVSLNLPVSFVEVEAVNPLITKATVRILYTGLNRNNSVISKEVAEKMAASLPNIPIVGEWDSNTGDFGGHGKEEYKNGLISRTTTPIGVVPADTKIWWEKFQDADGVEREYMCSHAYIWTGRYSMGKKIFQGELNNQSMELDPNTIKGTWTKSENKNEEYFIVEEALFSALCVLGEEVTPCFEGAALSPIAYSLLSSLEKKQVDTELDRLRAELSFALKSKTDFPQKGDDKEISLRNSQWPVFDTNFAENLKSSHPDIWKLGGNIKGNSQYAKLTQAVGKPSDQLSDSLKEAIKLREAWVARHKQDYLIAGVIAQIKWLAIGSRGESYMKNLVKEEIKRRKGDHALSEFMLLFSKEDDNMSIEETTVIEEVVVEETVVPEVSVDETPVDHAIETPVVEVEESADEHQIMLKDMIAQIVKEVLANSAAPAQETPSQDGVSAADEEEAKEEPSLEKVEDEEAKQKFAALEAEMAQLKEKLYGYEVKEKKEMVKKFEAIVSADFLKEILAQLDSFSLEEIESKLSVHAIRSGLVYTSQEETPVVEFTMSDKTSAPGWLSALGQ